MHADSPSDQSEVGWIGDERIMWTPLGIAPSLRSSVPLSIAILAVFAGYRLKGDMRVAVPLSATQPETATLSAFLTFLLRYPPEVNVPEVLVRWSAANLTHGAGSTMMSGDSPLVLASGGVDSTAALLWCLSTGQRPTALWVNYGQPYATHESMAITAICERLKVPLIQMRVHLDDEISGGTAVYRHIVPARNLLLTALGASLGADRIILAGLVDEQKVPDKSPRFYREASAMCKARVFSPFVNLTKTDVLALWRRHWQDIISPELTITCYDESGHCGRCRACIKRSIAFAAAGWGIDHSARVDPLADRDGIIEEDLLARWHSFSRVRQLDMLLAFRNAHLRMSPKIQEFAHTESGGRATEIEQRDQNLRLKDLPAAE